MKRQTLLISVLVAGLVLALWWMFIMTPQRTRLAEIEADIAAVEGEAVNLQARVTRLEAIRSSASEIEASIAALQSVVPTTTSLPSALRQIQAAADDAGLVITQLTSARPALVDDATGLHAITVAIAAEGSYFQMVDFLRRLEDPTITARGITVTTLGVAPLEYPTLQITFGANMYSVLDTFIVPEAAPAAPAADAPSEAPSEEATP